MSGANPAKPRLLYVVTEDWAFLSHRLPMARGFEVHVATHVSNGAAAIEAERFTLHSIPFKRGSLSPVATLSTISVLRRVHPIDGKPKPGAAAEIVLRHLMEGIGIALDVPGNRMFVTDLAGSIYSANLDGSQERNFLYAQGNLTGIAYAEI
jgi:hypothetical protein